MSNNIEQPKRRRIQQDKKTKKVKAKKISLISIIRLVSFLVILICIGIIIYRYINLKKADKIIESLNNDIQVNDKNIECVNIRDKDNRHFYLKIDDQVVYEKQYGSLLSFEDLVSGEQEDEIDFLVLMADVLDSKENIDNFIRGNAKSNEK